MRLSDFARATHPGFVNTACPHREIEDFDLRLHVVSTASVAAGIGRHQIEVNRWCLEMGGHRRTGLEDNVRWDTHRLAASNAELVKRVADVSGEYGRAVATPKVARAILELNRVQ